MPPLVRRFTSDDYICIIILMFAFFLYLPILQIWAYGDDFNMVWGSVDISSMWTIFTTNTFVFRPLERLVNSINVRLFGYETFYLVHIIALLGFLLSVLMVFKLALLLGNNSIVFAAFSAVYFAVMPANVMSIYQIDQLSQLYVTTFYLVLLYWLLANCEHSGFYRYVVSFILVLLTLLSKESSIGLIIITPFALYFLIDRPTKYHYDYFILFIIDTVAIIIYFLLRMIFGAGFGAGDHYSIHYSIKLILFNIIQLLAGIVYAGSSLDIYPQLRVIKFIISALVTFGLFSIMVVGIKNMLQNVYKQEIGTNFEEKLAGGRKIVGLSILMFAGMFPVVLIGKMSEVYTFSSSPFFALLLGFGLSEYLKVVHASRLFRTYGVKIVIGLLIFSIAWLGVGTYEKLQMTSEISVRSKKYFNQTLLWVEKLPETDVTCCWTNNNTQNEPINFGGFLMNDRVLLRGVIDFASKLKGKHIKYIENESRDNRCDYSIRVENGYLIFIHK